MSTTKTEQNSTPNDENNCQDQYDAMGSMCDCFSEMAKDKKGCPCKGMFKKRHMFAGIAVLSLIILLFLGTVAGSVLGTIAYMQTL